MIMDMINALSLIVAGCCFTLFLTGVDRDQSTFIIGVLCLMGYVVSASITDKTFDRDLDAMRNEEGGGDV